jgi:hypothetical protein
MKARAIQKPFQLREYGEIRTEVVLIAFSGIAFLMAGLVLEFIIFR